jgi:hypothetical protein
MTRPEMFGIREIIITNSRIDKSKLHSDSSQLTN